jgi:hypothetical protein
VIAGIRSERKLNTTPAVLNWEWRLVQRGIIEELGFASTLARNAFLVYASVQSHVIEILYAT